jgi:hypothetical protein
MRSDTGGQDDEEPRTPAHLLARDARRRLGPCEFTERGELQRGDVVGTAMRQGGGDGRGLNKQGGTVARRVDQGVGGRHSRPPTP